MHHRADYLLQVLEKIGSPLLTAVVDVQAVNPPQQGLQNEAQRIAELIARTVQASIELGSSLDLGPTGTMTDSIRVGLTGLASPIIAASYRNTGRAPAEADIKRLVAALQAVLSFAENFSADDDHTGRLRHVAASGAAVDSVQAQIQYFHAFLPVIQCIGQFSFGQPEQKFITDVAGRLTARATRLRADVFGDAGADNARIERGLLKALTEIYAAVHQSETARILSLSEGERAQITGGMAAALDILWQGFEIRISMLMALMNGMSGRSNSANGGAIVAPSAMQEPQAPPPSPPASPPPEPAQHAGINPMAGFSKDPASTAAPPAGNNPMSFFKAPPKTGE